MTPISLRLTTGVQPVGDHLWTPGKMYMLIRCEQVPGAKAFRLSIERVGGIAFGFRLATRIVELVPAQAISRLSEQAILPQHAFAVAHALQPWVHLCCPWDRA